MKNWNRKPGKSGGFTLIEMLVVVAIIAILIAVSIPLLSNALEKTRDSTDLANERAAKAAASLVYLGVGNVYGADGNVITGYTPDDEPLYYDAAAGRLVTKDGLGDIDPYGKCSQAHGEDEFVDGVNGPHSGADARGIIEVTFLARGAVHLTWVETDGSGGNYDDVTPGGDDEPPVDPPVDPPVGPGGGEGTGCTCESSSGGVCNCGDNCEGSDNCECTSCASKKDDNTKNPNCSCEGSCTCGDGSCECLEGECGCEECDGNTSGEETGCGCDGNDCECTEGACKCTEGNCECGEECSGYLKQEAEELLGEQEEEDTIFWAWYGSRLNASEFQVIKNALDILRTQDPAKFMEFVNDFNAVFEWDVNDKQRTEFLYNTKNESGVTQLPDGRSHGNDLVGIDGAVTASLLESSLKSWNPQKS